MLAQLSATIQRISRGWVVILLLVLYILTIGVAFPAIGRALGVPEQGVESIDTQLFYTPDQLHEMMAAYGEPGRQAYALQHVTADLLYPAVYALFFATTISFTFLRVFPRDSRVQRLNLFPFALALIDLVENLLLVGLLLAFPRQLTLLAWLAGIVTLFKWMAVAFTVALPIAGLVLWLVRLTRKGVGVSQLNESDKSE